MAKKSDHLSDDPQVPDYPDGPHYQEPKALLPATPVTDPLSIIARMVETGHGLDQIERMAALAEHMAAKRAHEAWNAAMALCQAQCPQVVRTCRGQHNMYAPLDEIDDAIRHVYTGHGFSLVFSEPEEAPNDPARLRAYCDVRHRDGHTVRVWGSIARDGVGPKGGTPSMNATQADGSTLSYFRRYQIYNIFGIVQRGMDKDGNAAALETLIEAEQSIISDLLRLKEPNLERFWAWVNEVHKSPTEPITTVAGIVRRHFPVIRDMLQKVKGREK